MVSIGIVREFHAVWPDGVEPDLTRLVPQPDSVGYRSTLIMTFDEPEERA